MEAGGTLLPMQTDMRRFSRQRTTLERRDWRERMCSRIRSVPAAGFYDSDESADATSPM